MFTVPVPLNSIAVQMTIICFVLPLSFWEHKENQYFYSISPLTVDQTVIISDGLRILKLPWFHEIMIVAN